MSKYPPQGQGWNAPGTCGGGYWRVVNGIYESWPPQSLPGVTIAGGVVYSMPPSKAPSSHVETTGAVSGTTVSYTGVVRPADEAETRSSALTEALARIESLWNVIRANGDTNSRLMRERDEARGEVGVAWEAHSQVIAQNDELRAALTRVEARCEDAEDQRRWLTAFEIRDALKTLYADPEFGFDKTAALSDPGEEGVSESVAQHVCDCPRHVAYRENLAANASAENEALRAEVASLRAFQLQHRRSL